MKSGGLQDEGCRGDVQPGKKSSRSICGRIIMGSRRCVVGAPDIE